MVTMRRCNSEMVDLNGYDDFVATLGRSSYIGHEGDILARRQRFQCRGLCSLFPNRYCYLGQLLQKLGFSDFVLDIHTPLMIFEYLCATILSYGNFVCFL